MRVYRQRYALIHICQYTFGVIFVYFISFCLGG